MKFVVASKGDKMKCNICGKETDELCHDLVCRECHISVSWEDCVNRTFDAEIALRGGMSLTMAKEWFPNADFEKIQRGTPIHTLHRKGE